MRNFTPLIFALFAASTSAFEVPEAFNFAKRLASATLLGTSLANLTARHENDIETGVVRLNDTNWDELVVNGEEEDIWVTVIHGPVYDQMARQYTAAHDNATRLAKNVEGLDHVHWARVDYMTEVVLCTKWLLSKPPYLLFASNRGKEMRWLAPAQWRPQGEALLKLMKTDQWRNAPLWKSGWAPGGNRAWLVDLYISGLKLWTKYTEGIPPFVFIIISGAIAQQSLAWFHRSSQPPPPATDPGGKPISREALKAALQARQAKSGESKKDQ